MQRWCPLVSVAMLWTPAHAAPPGATPALPTLEELQDKPERLFPQDDEEDPPPGYVALDKRRKGFIIAGSITFASGYLLASGFATDRNRPANDMWIPIVGPIVELAQRPNTLAANKPALLLTLSAELTGAVLLYFGLTSKRREFWRTDLVSNVRLVPTSSSDGFALAGSF